MVEVQYHGFSFEKWVRDTLFSGYTGNYMQKWDVPPEWNNHEAIPPHLRGQAVSIKTAKFGSPIGLGDVLRQRSIAEPFLLIVGFWMQRTPSEKWFEEIGYATFSPGQWNLLWGNIALKDLQELDQLVKDLTRHHADARLEAKTWKKTRTLNSQCEIIINPKNRFQKAASSSMFSSVQFVLEASRQAASS